jgi:hypothetical protein
MGIDSYVPTSPDGVAMHKLRRMVSLSYSLKKRCGIGTQELWERCFYRDADSEETMPFYVIDLNSGSDTLLQGGGQNFLVPKGTLLLIVEVGPKPGISRENDRRLEAVDTFSNLRKDIVDLSAADDPESDDGSSHLSITEGSLIQVMETPKKLVDTIGLRFTGIFTFTWGVGDN